MDIEARLETLEKKLRLHKRLGLAAACALVVAVVIGATKPVPKEIVAQSFVVRDASGKPRSAWGVTKKGEVLFAITDGKKPRLMITDGKDLTGMFIVGPQGKPRLSIGMMKGKKDKEKFPSIVLTDVRGKGQVFIIAKDRKESPSIALRDSLGNTRITLGVIEKAGEEEGTPSLGLYDSSEKLRVVLAVVDDESPGLVLLDGSDKVRAALGLVEKGEPRLRLLNKEEKAFWVTPPETK